MSTMPAPPPVNEPAVHLYTDGACSGNPGPGGWGCLIIYGSKRKELSGGEKNTTNNRMELKAAIEGLNALTRPMNVVVHADSQYVVKGITEWIPGWLRRGWKNAEGKAVLNRELWEELHAATQRHKIKWVWVKGHAGHAENERADALAVAAIPR